MIFFVRIAEQETNKALVGAGEKKVFCSINFPFSCLTLFCEYLIGRLYFIRPENMQSVVVNYSFCTRSEIEFCGSFALFYFLIYECYDINSFYFPYLRQTYMNQLSTQLMSALI